MILWKASRKLVKNKQFETIKFNRLLCAQSTRRHLITIKTRFHTSEYEEMKKKNGKTKRVVHKILFSLGCTTHHSTLHSAIGRKWVRKEQSAFVFQMQNFRLLCRCVCSFAFLHNQRNRTHKVDFYTLVFRLCLNISPIVCFDCLRLLFILFSLFFF